MTNKRRPAPKRKPLARRKGLKPSELKRSEKQLKRTELKRTEMKRAKLDPVTTSMAQIPAHWVPHWRKWHEAVLGRGLCAVCLRGRRGVGVNKVNLRMSPHHVVPQRYIRRRFRPMIKHLDREDLEERLIALLYDGANGMCLCLDCHEAHEKRTRPIPRSLIPKKALEFAEKNGFMDVIERLYPETE